MCVPVLVLCQQTCHVFGSCRVPVLALRGSTLSWALRTNCLSPNVRLAVTFVSVPLTVMLYLFIYLLALFTLSNSRAVTSAMCLLQVLFF